MERASDPPSSGGPPAPDTRSAEFDAARLEGYRRHVLSRIEQSGLGRTPFHHLFIEDVFPIDLYDEIKTHMLRYKYGAPLQDRVQDSPEFVNRRYSLADNHDPETRYIREIFSDAHVKRALLGRFYLEPTKALEEALTIHSEFEFVYTAARRFQNIHVDIPPKFVSFVFYLPDAAVSRSEEERNGTILYDKKLVPHYTARYRANAACVFVPHFYSYHGFASTIDRNALVMFYIDQAEQLIWGKQSLEDEPPFAFLKDAIQAKLTAHPLIEYGRDQERIVEERNQCLVNAPRGRVLRDDQGRPRPAIMKSV
jgi:hypothetical protein